MFNSIINPVYILVDLAMFGEGGEGGDGTGTGVTGSAAESQTGENGQAAAAETDYDAEFEEAIKGKYKDAYGRRVSKTVNARLKQLNERLKSQQGIVDKYNESETTRNLLARRYNVDIDDIAAINAAIEEDNAFFENEAFKNGVSVEQQKKEYQIKRREATIAAKEAEAAKREAFQQKYSGWKQQEQAMKALYPDFDFDAEFSQNPQFISLLDSGIDVKTAFEVLHHDEIMPAALQYAATKAEQKVVNKVKANGMRPNENGISSASAATSKQDISKMTPAQLEDLYQRSLRGEKIIL